MSGDDELAFIDRVQAVLGRREGVEGIGDDAAQLRTADGALVALDTMVEGVHFRRDWSSWFDIGWKLFATNASDLFAMGATPTAWLLSAALAGVSRADADALIAGLSSARDALAPDAELVGGDTTRGPGSSVLSICMHGRCTGPPIQRAGAQHGDHVYVRGVLGWAAAGLRQLARGETSGPFVDAHRRPCPMPIGAEDASRLTAAMDVSDGLALDAARLAQASNVVLVFDAPLPGEEALMAAFSADEVVEMQWHGGDDYALLATSAVALGPPWFRVGGVRATTEMAGGAGVLRLDSSGRRASVAPRGYAHRFD